MRLVVYFMKRDLPIMKAVPNWLQPFFRINCLIESYNQSSPPPLLDKRWLPRQCVFHGTVISVGEGKKPTHVSATIGASNQLVAISEDINYRFESDDLTKLFKEGQTLSIC
jgi:hypothetical protein